MKGSYDLKQFTGHEGWKEYLRQLGLLEGENLKSFISKSFALVDEASDPQAAIAFENFRKGCGVVIHHAPSMKLKMLGVVLTGEFKTRHMDIPKAP